MDTEQWRAEAQSRIDRLLFDLEQQPNRPQLDELGEVVSETPLRGPILSDAQRSRLETLLTHRAIDDSLAGPGITRCHLTLATHASQAARHEDAVRHGLVALRWALRAGHPLTISRAQKCLGVYLAHAGRFREAIAMSADALSSLAGAQDQPEWERIGILLNIGIIYFWCGRYVRASRLLRYAHRLAQRRKVRPPLLCALNACLASMHLTAGNYRAGLEYATTAAALARECCRAGMGAQLELAHYYLARLQMEVGLLTEAKATLQEASELHKDPISLSLLTVARGLCAVQEGDIAVGLALIEEGVNAGIEKWPYTAFTEACLAAAKGYELAGLHGEATARIELVIRYLLRITSEQLGETGVDSCDALQMLRERRRLLVSRARLSSSSPLMFKMEELAAQAEGHEYPCLKHPHRVGRLSYFIARRLGMRHDEASEVMIGGKLHDIGKCALPPQLLASTFPLSATQAQAVRIHSTIGEQLLRDAPGSGFSVAAAVARSHHERWDGTGYPDQLKGEQIPLAARIVAVAEAFDAMTHDRPGRPARSVSAALAELVRQSGRQFDPIVVSAAVACIEELRGSDSGVDAQLEHSDEPSSWADAMISRARVTAEALAA